MHNPIWRYMRACRHSQLSNAGTVCIQVCLLFSALGYVRLCSTSFRTTADTVAPRHSKKVSHAQYPIWRYMRACRHSQLFEASAIANKFASQGLRTTATPFYISPNRGIAKKIFALLSVSVYVCTLFAVAKCHAEAEVINI